MLIVSNNTIEIGERVCTLELKLPEKEIYAVENCDFYFDTTLSIEEIKQLINALINFYNKICGENNALILFTGTSNSSASRDFTP